MPKNSSSPGSPGITGALKDAIGAIAGYLGPKAVTERKPKLAQDEARSAGDEADRIHDHSVNPESGE